MIQETADIVNEALTYTRNLMTELSPPVLREFGLVVALRCLADQMRRYALSVTVQTDVPGDIRLPEDQAVLLFQSVRKLLINVAKHAGSSQASILIEEPEGYLKIVVKHHGVGFDLAAVTPQEVSPLSSKFGL